MSAKLLRAGGEQMFSRNHIAIGNSVFPKRKPVNREADVSVRERQTPGQLAAAEWMRLRHPCRRAEWWR